jgi:aconitate hydratase
MTDNRDLHHGARVKLETDGGSVNIYKLEHLEKEGLGQMSRLPFSIRVLLESLLRQSDGILMGDDDIRALSSWNPHAKPERELPFKPARVLLQDFTGVPAIVDLAAMRSAVARLGGDPSVINPQVPVDLVIDHSVQVDFFGTPEALERNAEIEFSRNRERYEFLRWGTKAFENFRVVPPATGIVHQVNLEFLAKVVNLRESNEGPVALFDSLVGTDSHTTMINGLGVVGWGVGGIEAEAVMLGQPLYMLTPQVVGFKLTGQLRDGVTATDLTLTVTQMLREIGVVDKFVEFYGSGLSKMTLPDRATMANMSPEYGATMGYFPIDDETLRFMERTGRTKSEVDLVERYTKEQGVFRTDETPDPEYSASLHLDLADVEPSLAGPKRPQDRVRMADLQSSFRKILTTPPKERGFGLNESQMSDKVEVSANGNGNLEMTHGSVVIAAITSCTNTSNPSVMIGAGLLAKKACERGLKVPAFVKTSMAPGSQVVTRYLEKSDLLTSLEQLGFDIVGYGCTTCIGNSGPLPEYVANAVQEGNLVSAAVLSGNRNFEGRIHAHVKANYLASPPLVVAYALAGTVDIDLSTDSLGTDSNGNPVFLGELWPTQQEISDIMTNCIDSSMFTDSYGNVFDGNETWNAIVGVDGEIYNWEENSTYIQDPPFFEGFGMESSPPNDVQGARVLAILGDSVTTDHISPAGAIAKDGPAGKFLLDKGVERKDFNSFGSRRGNDRVMTRGTFANIRIKNLLVPGTEGGITVHHPSGAELSIFDAAMKYKEDNTPLLVFAGKEYGTGSSRDWAAKGTLLLGVKVVVAESFERIHRSNLVGMGVLPLQFESGENVESLGLTGQETFDIEGISEITEPGQKVRIRSTDSAGKVTEFTAVNRLDTPVDVRYYKEGGILQTVMRQLIREN